MFLLSLFFKLQSLLSALHVTVGYYRMGVKLDSCQPLSVSTLETLLLLTSSYSHVSVRSERAQASLQSHQNFSFGSWHTLLMTNYKSGKKCFFRCKHSAWEITIHFAIAPIKELGNVLIYMGPYWQCGGTRWYLAHHKIKIKKFFREMWCAVLRTSHMMFVCKCIGNFCR